MAIIRSADLSNKQEVDSPSVILGALLENAWNPVMAAKKEAVKPEPDRLGGYPIHYLNGEWLLIAGGGYLENFTLVYSNVK